MSWNDVLTWAVRARITAEVVAVAAMPSVLPTTISSLDLDPGVKEAGLELVRSGYDAVEKASEGIEESEGALAGTGTVEEQTSSLVVDPETPEAVDGPIGDADFGPEPTPDGPDPVADRPEQPGAEGPEPAVSDPGLGAAVAPGPEPEVCETPVPEAAPGAGPEPEADSAGPRPGATPGPEPVAEAAAEPDAVHRAAPEPETQPETALSPPQPEPEPVPEAEAGMD